MMVDELSSAMVSRDDVRVELDKWLMTPRKPRTRGDVQESSVGHENNVDPAAEAMEQQKMMSLFT